MGSLLIPPIHIHEQESGAYDVVDGKQRLTSILAFFLGTDIGGVAAPTMLSIAPDEEADEEWQPFNGKFFKDFDLPSRRNMMNYDLPVYVIGKDTDPEALISIYRAINSGSINCNPQQIRKCVFNGPYVRLLDKLCKDSAATQQFQQLLGNDKPDDEKEQDRQYALRYVALKRSMLDGYKQMKGINKLLNQELQVNRHLDGDKEKAMEQEFQEVVSTVFEVFGENAFKKYNFRTKKHDTKMSAPMFDTVMLGVWRALTMNRHKKQALIQSAGDIQAGVQALFDQPEWTAAIPFTKSNSLLVRQQLFDEVVNKGVKGKQLAMRRAAPAGLREALYAQQQGRCALCSSPMHDIRTTEVDPIVPLARGGRDAADNMQLVHQGCNRKKGARTDEELQQAGAF